MGRQQKRVGRTAAADGLGGLALATLEHEVARGHRAVYGRLPANGARAGNEDAFAHQRSGLEPLGRGDQVERPALVVGAPTAPVAQGLEPGQDLGFSGNGLSGHVSSEYSVGEPRRFAKLNATHPDHVESDPKCRSCSLRPARALAGAEWGPRWDASLLAEDRRLAALATLRQRPPLSSAL